MDTYLSILNEKDIEPQLTAPTGYSLDFHGHYISQFKSVSVKSVIITPPEIKDQRVLTREKLANRSCRIVVEELENLVVRVLCRQS